MQTIGARYAHGEITLEQAAEAGCHACASPGGGCQFLGTAATSQVVGEALGLTPAALGPGPVRPADLARHGPPVGAARWSNMSEPRHHARSTSSPTRRSATPWPCSRRSAAARTCCCTSPAIAFHAGRHAADHRRLDALQPPGAAAGGRPAERPGRPPDDPRLPGRRRARGDAAPARPRAARTRRPDRQRRDARRRSSTGGQKSERRRRLRDLLRTRDGIDPDTVIMSPDAARRRAG